MQTGTFNPRTSAVEQLKLPELGLGPTARRVAKMTLDMPAKA